MVSGHSYLLNDRDLGSVESIKRRTQHVFTPDEWRSLVADARRCNPFCVRKMKQQDFKAIDTLTEYTVNRKITAKKEKVEWLKIRWIRVQKSEPLRLKYRMTHNDLEERKEVDLKPKQAWTALQHGPSILSATLREATCDKQCKAFRSDGVA